MLSTGDRTALDGDHIMPEHARHLIRTCRISGIATALLLALPLAASAQLHAYGAPAPEPRFVLIANSANAVSALQRHEASKLFLGKRATWPNGSAAQPVDLVESSSVRRRFSTDIHGMGVQNVKTYWHNVALSGKGEPPPERASDADVIAFVKSHPNALGYVGSATAADGVKIISVIP
jgi:ABC-type phosphate transport system substrate-binding protein